MRASIDPKHTDWMKTLPGRVSNGAMMLESDAGELLIVKANYKTYWTLPGGIVDTGETPKQAAIRETLEETGITVDPHSVTFVAVVDRISDAMQTYQFIFKAPLPAGAAKAITLQASEIEAYKFVKKTDVAADDPRYAQAVRYWASGMSGYIEQIFEQASGAAPRAVEVGNA